MQLIKDEERYGEQREDLRALGIMLASILPHTKSDGLADMFWKILSELAGIEVGSSREIKEEDRELIKKDQTHNDEVLKQWQQQT